MRDYRKEIKAMKKVCFRILVFLTGLVFCVPALAVNEDVEGELVIYTSMYANVVEMMDEALKAEFPNLTPGNGGSFFFRSGSGQLITKIYGEMGDGRNQALGCDMLMVAEPAFSLELKEYDYLHSFALEDAENLLRFPYDPDGTWYPVRVCNMVLAYDPEMKDTWANEGITVPKTFRDFAYDPSLKGYISMGDPATSGTSYAAVVALTDKYGEEYLDKLRENNVKRDSGPQAIASLQGKDCAVLMTLEETVLNYIGDEAAKGNTNPNVEIIYPEDGVVLIPSNVMIVAEEFSKNANIDAAEAVAQWFLSPEGQAMIVKGNMHSTLKNVGEPAGSVSTDELIGKDIGVDWEKAYRDREAILELWARKVTQ